MGRFCKYSMKERPVYASTSCIPVIQPVTERVQEYLRHGISSIELGAGVTVDDQGLSDLSKVDCRLLIHNYFPPRQDAFVINLASRNPEIREKSIVFVCNAIDLCGFLSIPFYSMHAGFVTDPIECDSSGFVFPSPDSPDDVKRAMTQFISSLKTCAAYAQNKGIFLTIENNVCPKELIGKLLLQTADEFLTFFQSTSSRNVGILLDTGHLNVTAKTLGLDRLQFAKEVAPYVRALHVHDNDGVIDSHRPVQPGSWVFDVLALPELSQLPIIVEAKFDTIDDIRRHVDWLKKERKSSR